MTSCHSFFYRNSNKLALVISKINLKKSKLLALNTAKRKYFFILFFFFFLKYIKKHHEKLMFKMVALQSVNHQALKVRIYCKKTNKQTNKLGPTFHDFSHYSPPSSPQKKRNKKNDNQKQYLITYFNDINWITISFLPCVFVCLCWIFPCLLEKKIQKNP